MLGDYAGDNARHAAVEIAASPDTQHAMETANYTGVLQEFRRRQPTLQGGFAVAVVDGDAVASWNAPQPWAMLRRDLPALPHVERSPQKWVFNKSEYLLSAAAAGTSAKILVGLPLPNNFSPTLGQIRS